MGRQIDEELWDAWRRRLARYEVWSGTVAAFCVREGVSAVTFYQWRRKLAGEPTGGRSRATEERGESHERPSFLPVRIAGAERIEIELPNGVRVRVPGDATRTLDAVLAAAARCELVAERTEARAC